MRWRFPLGKTRSTSTGSSLRGRWCPGSRKLIAPSTNHISVADVLPRRRAAKRGSGAMQGMVEGFLAAKRGGLSWPPLGELDNSGGEQTVQDSSPQTSNLFLSSAAEQLCGRRIELVPLLQSLAVLKAGVEMIRPTCSFHRAKSLCETKP